MSQLFGPYRKSHVLAPFCAAVVGFLLDKKFDTTTIPHQPISYYIQYVCRLVVILPNPK